MSDQAKRRLYELLTVGDIRRAESALASYMDDDAEEGIDVSRCVGIVVDALAEGLAEREVLDRLAATLGRPPKEWR
jgi:hypothetical protein